MKIVSLIMILIYSFVLQFYSDFPDSVVHQRYDPVKIASVNRVTSTQTKLNALLALINRLNWRKFVVVTDNEHESNHFVNLLKETLRPRNLEMKDWLVFPFDSLVENMSNRFGELGSDANTIILLTNNLKLAFDIFYAKEHFISKSSWVFLSDLDIRTLTSYSLPEDIFTLAPKYSQEATTSGFVYDGIQSISHALRTGRDGKVFTCPKMSEFRR